jgi:hypothetical protein
MLICYQERRGFTLAPSFYISRRWRCVATFGAKPFDAKHIRAKILLAFKQNFLNASTKAKPAMKYSIAGFDS